MPEATRSPVEHYREAERLLAAMPPLDGLTVRAVVYFVGASLTHAILATVNPKSLRGRHQHRKYTDDVPGTSGGSLHQRWLRGEDIEPGDPSR